MTLYLIKRILWALPSLWLITSMVFLLSRLLPGNYGHESILKESGSYYSTGKAEAREAAYASYLRKTGQHLPLFYFSLQSAAEPDTLFSITTEQDRQLLKRLSWTYGNGQAATAYYRAIKELEQELHLRNKQQLLTLTGELFTNAEPQEIHTTIRTLEGQIGSNLTANLNRAAVALVKQRQNYKLFLPALYWHGTQNQYHQWLTKLWQGDLGSSFRDNRSVVEIMAEAIKTTMLLLLISMLITATLALELGIFMIRQSGRRWRKIILPALFLTDRIPVFLLALLLLTLFASPDYLQLFPVYGLGYYTSPETHWLQHYSNLAQYLVLPVVCLVLVNLPYLTSQFYRALADVSQTEYIKTAKAKGLAESAIIRKHILRNALLPVITLLTDFIPALVAGAVVVETVFAIPGIGSLLVQAVQARDYPVIVGIVTVVALAKILSHLVADILYSMADPRIRIATS